ncbi:helix-turn-helix domain-containing protein [Clostridium chromiireducens]|uniref:helix-turn-helix domain-containing protein n=1 Tax=Clostridium chromiireducens TaxID=225345 RepID=UPI003AF4FDD1
MINTGKNIKAKREERNLTQKQLAEKLNVQTVTICRWESGDREPSISKLDQLSHTLEVTIDNLIYGESYNDDQGNDMIAEIELAILLSEKVFLEPSEKPENIVYEKGVLDGLKKALDLMYDIQY